MRNAIQTLLEAATVSFAFAMSSHAAFDDFGKPEPGKSTGILTGSPMSQADEQRLRRRIPIDSDAATADGGGGRQRETIYQQPFPTPCSKLDGLTWRTGPQYFEIYLDHDQAESKIREGIANCGKASVGTGLATAYLTGGNVDAAAKAFFATYKVCLVAYTKDHYAEVVSADTRCAY
ncbi:hypothetical protein [Variovorax ginsengisoli]|uniref:Uncharacterized protein n=1 Tax=Variovorax ginsengisoli TaxID=363844 RepID=A0ABT8S7A7_9BURK|nr:hypothetical protein [Variovorax ginsengisoli]MDN8615635.1 hypothetical protein [Variovorax ginsengisoli]MDO1534805.1 hypothetical protein [Variovorax ginsengisoli]